MDSTVNGLLEFIEKSPTVYQAVQTSEELLKAHGFIRLEENEPWILSQGQRYYVTRGGSALIAFVMGTASQDGYQIFAAHGDSPTFKIKPNPEIINEHYVRLNVEKYGGMILSTWFDRPLSVAGRVVVKTDSGVEARSLVIDRDLLVIPNVAIHMNREINDGYKYNVQIDLLPLLGMDQEKGVFLQLIADELGVGQEEILDYDLYLYHRTKPTIFGVDQSLIGAPRLDDLQCAYAGLCGILEATPKDRVAMFAMFDNEEVGSLSYSGAASTFLRDTLTYINDALGNTPQKYLSDLHKSFVISADNAHAVHPAHPEWADPSNRPLLNGGIVLKYSGNQKYTTNGVSGAVLKDLCHQEGVPVQTFANRSDRIGGSTLGNLSIGQVGIQTVDIGLPQLAMHSSYETAGVKDTEDLIRVAKRFFNTTVQISE